MAIRILFYATLKEKAGANQLVLDLPAPILVSDVQAALVKDHPELAPYLQTALVAVNHEYADANSVIPDGGEVAFFPPVSGGNGATICKIITDPLDQNQIVAELTDESIGAVCVFTGIVRGKTTRGDFPATRSLEYEAYVPMAEKKLFQIAEEIRQRWPEISGVALIQRIGLLEPQTPTVLVACSAGHRDTGIFDAAHYGIDRIKEIVPIWKKEIGPNGETWVEGHYRPQVGE